MGVRQISVKISSGFPKNTVIVKILLKRVLPFGATGATKGWTTAVGVAWAAGCRLAGLAVVRVTQKEKHSQTCWWLQLITFLLETGLS